MEAREAFIKTRMDILAAPSREPIANRLHAVDSYLRNYRFYDNLPNGGHPLQFSTHRKSSYIAGNNYGMRMRSHILKLRLPDLTGMSLVELLEDIPRHELIELMKFAERQDNVTPSLKKEVRELLK